VLIAWDAPLGFDSSSFSDRPVDRTIRRFINEKVKAGVIAPKAVSVLPFSGCPHWVISCATLGYPYGPRLEGSDLSEVKLVPSNQDSFCSGIIEVHPAVTLAIWWLERNIDFPLPRYKKNGLACKAISEALSDLEIPMEAAQSDDALDSWVAWRMGKDFLTGEAVWIGCPSIGGLVLPASAISLWQLNDEVAQMAEKMQANLSKLNLKYFLRGPRRKGILRTSGGNPVLLEGFSGDPSAKMLRRAEQIADNEIDQVITELGLDSELE